MNNDIKTAFYNSKLASDSLILVLSFVGIFIVKDIQIDLIYLKKGAFVFYFSAIIAQMFVFTFSQNIMIARINNETINDFWLVVFDWLATLCFLTGIISTAMLLVLK